MYSNAFNFSSFLDGGVDMRTGQYSVSLPLLTLHCLYDDISHQIGLSFSMMNSSDSGFGLGWSLSGFSQYSDTQVKPASPTLTLSNGETYQAQEQGNDIILKDKKINDVYVTKVDNETVRIIYKQGIIETLTRVADGKPYQLTQIQFENGDAYTIEYQYFGALVLPKSITDANGVARLKLISLNNDGVINKVLVRTVHNQELEYQLFDRANGKLMSITLVDSNKSFEPMLTKFQYKTDFLAIEKIENPLGGIELISYQSQGHVVGALSPNGYLPYVIKHERIPGNSIPSTVFSYQYSTGQNFSGYPFNNQDPSQTEDNLHYYIGTYNYWTKESLLDEHGNELVSHTITYNRYHLPISEEYAEGICRYSRITTYNDEDGQDFYQQPADLQLPKLIEAHFAEELSENNIRSRTETQTFEYDEYGNNLSAVDIDGTETRLSYYISTGETGCPADPFGRFVRYVKQSQQLAAGNDVTVKVTDYQYQPLPTNTVTEYMVVRKQTTFDDVFIVTSQYQSHLGSPFHGLASTETEKQTDKVTTNTYQYSITDDQFKTVTTTTGFDNTQKETCDISCLYTQAELSFTDCEGVTEQYQYDALSRVIETINALGSEYENSQTCHYYLPNSNNNIQRYNKVITNEWGLATRIQLDGFGRELITEEQDDYGDFDSGGIYSGTFREVAGTNYDNRGRPIAEWAYDYNLGEQVTQSRQDYTYDDWGQICETHNSDGTVQTIVTDPIAMTQLEGQYAPIPGGKQHLAYTRTTYNLFRKPILVELLHSDGMKTYSSNSAIYDGFGRITSVTIPSGATATIDAYDALDRPIEATHFDGTKHTAEYCETSAEMLVTRVSALVDNETINFGNRTFDGLNRVNRRQVANSSISFDYNAGSQFPSMITNGREQLINITMVPELGQLKALSTQSDIGAPLPLTKSFEFSTKTDPNWPAGIKKSASNDQGEYLYTYSQTGRTETVEYTSADDTSFKIAHENVSLSGNVLESKLDNRVLNKSFDSQGRLIQTIDGNLTVTNTYDSFGRPKQTLTYHQNEVVQTTTLEYDEFDREISRKVAVGNETMDVQSEYDNQNRLVNRTRLLTGGEKIVERLSYDSRSRLTEYNIDDGYSHDLLPVNELGNAIIGQSFEYDGLNNLLKVTTRFPTSEEVDTASYDYDGLRLIKIEHTLTAGENAFPSEVIFSYDADGNINNIANGDQSLEMEYSPLNQLAKVNGVDYFYDTYSRLITTGDTRRSYQGQELIKETSSVAGIEFVRHADALIAERDGDELKLLTLDKDSSVIRTYTGEKTTHTSYTPFGMGNSIARSGFNGELRDSQSGGYLLGNGTRLYLPQTAQFTSIDTLSPFSSGGFNPYRYCMGDPINLSDPSGHAANTDAIIGGVGIFVGIFSFVLAPFTGGSSIAIGAAMTSAALGTVSSSLKLASGLTEDEETSYALNKWSKGFGIASAVTGVAGIAADLGKTAYKASTKGYTTSYKLTGGYTTAEPKMLEPKLGKSPRSFTKKASSLGRKSNFERNDPMRKGAIRKGRVGFNSPRAGKQVKNYEYKAIPGSSLKIKKSRQLTESRRVWNIFSKKEMGTQVNSLFNGAYSTMSSVLFYTGVTPPENEESSATRQVPLTSSQEQGSH